MVAVVALAAHGSIIHIHPKLPTCNLASYNEGDIVTKYQDRPMKKGSGRGECPLRIIREAHQRREIRAIGAN
jgi:hypothetical protein